MKYALTTDVVRAAANTTGSGTNGGTDVTVTVMVTGTATESVAGNNNISTHTLDRGSVTVVGPRGFNLQLNGNLLTLSKGYRLKGFKITSGDPGGSTRTAAIKLAGVGTSLENMNIDCEGLGTGGTNFTTTLGDRCIEVTATTLGGTILLQGLEVQIKGDKNYTAAIVHSSSDPTTTLRVVGSTIRSTGNNGQGVVGVLGLGALGGALVGPVIVQSSTVDLESITSGTSAVGGQVNIAVLLNVGGSKVLGSRIKLNGQDSSQATKEGSIGVKVNHSSGLVVVEGTTFTTKTNEVGIGIKKEAGTGSLNLVNNSFPLPPCGSGNSENRCLWKNVDPP